MHAAVLLLGLRLYALTTVQLSIGRAHLQQCPVLNSLTRCADVLSTDAIPLPLAPVHGYNCSLRV
jgi:hypothetical protein